MEFDDDFIVSAVKEVKEETNLDVEIDEILNVSSSFLSRDLHTTRTQLKLYNKS